MLDHLAPGGSDGPIGDRATYAIRVANVGNTALNNLKITGNLDNLGRCNRPTLAAGSDYVCWYGSHRISAADQRRGSFIPRVTATGTDADIVVRRAAKGARIVVPAH